SRAAARHMIPRNSGKIINIASIAGLAGQIYRTAYATSKAAVINLTKVLAIELAKYNINVNAVLPGYVMTDLVRDHIAKGRVDLDAIVRRTPLGRISSTEDVAYATMFLASEEAKSITGVGIPVDGGWSADGWYM
ncbi:MAG: SDR family oxidoreductase, partial [Dehalococcoidia bacterium]|nr:SDR family oxidoreductase [Dehalococcoidia bacterium]